MSDGSTLRALLADRDVRLVMISRFCNAAAASALALGAGKLVFDMTGREIDLGFIGLAEFLPTALLVLIAGSMADRYDRRRIASIALLSEAAVAAATAWYTSTSPTSPGLLFVFVLLFGTARGFANPASRSIPPLVAPDGELPRVMSTIAATWQLAAVAGPVIAGFLYTVDPVWPFVAIAAMLVISAASLHVVEYRRPQDASDERPSLRSAMEGLRFVRSEPILLAAIGLDLFAVLFGGAVALAPALAEERLGVGALGLGWLRAAGGIGAGVTALYLAANPFNRRVGRTLLVAVGIFGIGTIGLGLTRSFWVALLLLGLIAAADMVSVYIRLTIVPLVTPDRMRGRVLAVEAVFIGASNELGAFESGVTAEWFGLVGSIVLGGAMTLLVVLIWWFSFRGLREIDRFEDLESA
ncbi:MAG: MFS transporter [Actinomycetia bacterium]|nr:MFS transporter [Actinomycetes bacterium]MCP4962653.1 MFS transporter [Actinomycetes bacterium]